jgi:hypothetical protein
MRAGPLLALAALVGACAGRRPVVVAPVPDANQTALALEAHAQIEHPTRIIFGWELNESGVRTHGRGVARLEGPYRARLDLFLSNGEGVVSAALVGEDLRLPDGAPKDILPPPELMWGVLGVFRPELGAELLGADRLEDGGIQLRYRYQDGRKLRYEIQNGQVVSIEVLEGDHTTQRVRLTLSRNSRYPADATYRNLTAFRELKLTRESVQQVEPYPPDIWDPVR